MQEADERPVIPLEDDMSEQGSCVQKKKVTKKTLDSFSFHLFVAARWENF